MTHFPKPLSPMSQHFLLCAVGGEGGHWPWAEQSPGGGKGLESKERTEGSPLNQESRSHQLSISDTKTELRQVAYTQEAEVLGFCDLNAAFPSSSARQGPGARACVLVCPTVLLLLVPAGASDSSKPLSPLTPTRLLLIGPLNPPAVSPENQHGYTIQWAKDHDKEN